MSLNLSKIGILIVAFVLITFSGQSQQHGMAISTDSTAIFYRTFGDGSPLLIINGGPGMNSDGFEGLAMTLSKNHLTIIYDQRGTGKSPLKVLDTSTITMQLMIADIESIRKKLGIEQWSILGHSFGGMVASYYAVHHPDRIDKVVLSSSGGINLGLLKYVRQSLDSRLSKASLDSIAYWAAKMEGGDTSHYARLQRGRFLAPAYVLDSTYFPVIAERLTQGNPVLNQLMWVHLAKIGFDCAPGLKAFDRPVLIIQGMLDIVRPSSAEEAQRALLNSKIVYVEDCIHYGWLDNPEVYFAEVNGFLGLN